MLSQARGVKQHKQCRSIPNPPIGAPSEGGLPTPGEEPPPPPLYRPSSCRPFPLCLGATPRTLARLGSVRVRPGAVQSCNRGHSQRCSHRSHLLTTMAPCPLPDPTPPPPLPRSSRPQVPRQCSLASYSLSMSSRADHLDHPLPTPGSSTPSSTAPMSVPSLHEVPTLSAPHPTTQPHPHLVSPCHDHFPRYSFGEQSPAQPPFFHSCWAARAVWLLSGRGTLAL